MLMKVTGICRWMCVLRVVRVVMVLIVSLMSYGGTITN